MKPSDLPPALRRLTASAASTVRTQVAEWKYRGIDPWEVGVFVASVKNPTPAIFLRADLSPVLTPDRLGRVVIARLNDVLEALAACDGRYVLHKVKTARDQAVWSALLAGNDVALIEMDLTPGA